MFKHTSMEENCELSSSCGIVEDIKPITLSPPNSAAPPVPIMHLSSASIGNQWETGKTWSPGNEGGDQYQQETDVRTMEGAGERERQPAKRCENPDLGQKKSKRSEQTKAGEPASKQTRDPSTVQYVCEWRASCLKQKNGQWGVGVGKERVNAVLTANVKRQKIWGNNWKHN